MMPGGDPIDCIQPLMPHSTANARNSSMVESPMVLYSSPIDPIRRLTTAEMISPVAMNLLMLQ